MSAYWVPMLVCDKCMPGVAFSVIDGKFDTEVTPGYCVGISVSTALACGWVECDYGHFCPTCAASEREQQEQDETTGVEHGAISLPQEDPGNKQ